MVRPRDGRTMPAGKPKEPWKAEGLTGTKENQPWKAEGPTGIKENRP